MRGVFENNFEIIRSTSIIASTDNETVVNKVQSKIETFVTNIKQDILNEETTDFSHVKLSFKSKYKNLPAKFHPYLDEIIKANLR